MIFQVEVLVAKNPAINKVFTNPILAPVRWVLGKIYVFGFMGYCLAPFTFFKDFWSIYGSLYYMGFVVFIGWRIIAPFLMPRLLRRPKSESSSASVNDRADSSKERVKKE